MVDEFRINSTFPALFVILLDQSASMRDPIIGGTLNKAEFAATALNNIIYAMLNEAKSVEGQRKTYAYLSLWGYNNTVFPLLPKIAPHGEPIALPVFEDQDKVAGFVTVYRDVKDTSNPGAVFREAQVKPYWIVPHASGNTQMALGFRKARDVVKAWLKSTPEPGQASRGQCFPPIVIHITDAQDNGDNNPHPFVEEIQNESTTQGNCLVFNCHFSKEMSQSCVFPGDNSEVEHLDPPFASQLFKMSSVIPDVLQEKAKEIIGKDRILSKGARSFVYNADAETLVKFLHWGTIGTTQGGKQANRRRPKAESEG